MSASGECGRPRSVHSKRPRPCARCLRACATFEFRAFPLSSDLLHVQVSCQCQSAEKETHFLCCGMQTSTTRRVDVSRREQRLGGVNDSTCWRRMSTRRNHPRTAEVHDLIVIRIRRCNERMVCHVQFVECAQCFRKRTTPLSVCTFHEIGDDGAIALADAIKALLMMLCFLRNMTGILVTGLNWRVGE